MPNVVEDDEVGVNTQLRFVTGGEIVWLMAALIRCERRMLA